MDSDTQQVTLQTPAISSRNLMSKQRQSTREQVTMPSDIELSALLQKSTSRLQCGSKTDHDKSNDDYKDVLGNLAELNSASHSGYILVISFHEQQTKASENLFGLQCWAKSLFVNIVEPFVENSHLVVPLNSTQKTLLKYRDIFDLGVWQLLSLQQELAPLASWDSFLAKAPRQLIVVHFKYLTIMRYKQLKDQNESVTHMAVDGTFKDGCHETSPELFRKIKFLTELHNFTVIREVCINFANGDQLTLFQFSRHLYGGIKPDEVTVLMEEWRGFSYLNNGRRVALPDACPLSSSVHSLTYTWPSKQLICNAKRYRQKYLKTSNYITVMVRTEKMVSMNTSQEYMANCLGETLRQWQLMKTTYGVEKTFLSMDIGVYGSYSLLEKDYRYTPFVHLYEEFLRKLFGPQATMRAWEMDFEAVALQRDSGYIGSLQKTVAAQSRCIVFTGGGSFQKHTKYMYERVTGKKKWCVKVINECSRGIGQ